MSKRVLLTLSCFLALSAPGCLVFDASLYQAREMDAGATPDAGRAVLALADDCTGAVPEVRVPEGAADISIDLDTRGLSDDYSNLTCTGRPAPGPDGFFAVQMEVGERWHFHVRRRGDGADPVIFVLPAGCDERQCDLPNGLDACGVDSDEHLSFRAPSAGLYLVGVDSRNADGFEATVQVIRPTCGNGVMDHSETCDDDNNVDGDGCDAECRRELPATGASEAEVNDDAFGANVLTMTTGATTVSGRIGALCESDVFAVDVPEGASLTATVGDAADAACPAGTPSMELQLISSNGITIRGRGTARGGSECPSIDATDAFATGLAAGRYFVRIYAVNTEVVRPFDYRLRVTVTSP